MSRSLGRVLGMRCVFTIKERDLTDAHSTACIH
jgi:hypothetical protein